MSDTKAQRGTERRKAHTPGPWFIFGNGHCVGGPHAENGTAGIAMCGMRLRSPDECDANARLIVAAPLLLDSLKWSIQFAEKFAADHNDGPTMASCIAQAKRAVELAEGRAK